MCEFFKVELFKNKNLLSSN